MTLKEKLEALKQYDTPSITNVVASYPDSPKYCLGLYDAWEGKWYTDQNLKCMFPEVGRVAGLAVTCTYALPGQGKAMSIRDILHAMRDAGAPTILAIYQDMPDRIRERNGLCGGNMMTAFKQAGCVGVLSNGPSRDLDEIRPLNMQYMLTGVTPGHGNFDLVAVNTPVEICGMEVQAGEVIHMDENGAVKFPLEHLDQVLERLALISAREADSQKHMRETDDVDKVADIIGEIFYG